jgi:hypothetical protein
MCLEDAFERPVPKVPVADFLLNSGWCCRDIVHQSKFIKSTGTYDPNLNRGQTRSFMVIALQHFGGNTLDPSHAEPILEYGSFRSQFSIVVGTC